MLRELKLKDVDDEIVRKMQAEACNRGIDLNTFIITLFKQALGMEETFNQDEEYHDLDYLAGTWTGEEAESFHKATESFGTIDPELWQ
jgi:hypothetical protein